MYILLLIKAVGMTLQVKDVFLFSFCSSVCFFFYALSGIFFKIFFSLGITESLVGNMVYPCSLLNTCFNPDAHVLQVTDMFDPSYAQKVREKHQKPVFASVAVRDPLMMVASAYCYHHEGQEPLNTNFPSKET